MGQRTLTWCRTLEVLFVPLPTDEKSRLEVAVLTQHCPGPKLSGKGLGGKEGPGLLCSCYTCVVVQLVPTAPELGFERAKGVAMQSEMRLASPPSLGAHHPALTPHLSFPILQGDLQKVQEHLCLPDRRSLLSEVQALRAQLRMTHLQNQEKLQQLCAALTSTEARGSQREHQLRRQGGCPCSCHSTPAPHLLTLLRDALGRRDCQSLTYKGPVVLNGCQCLRLLSSLSRDQELLLRNFFVGSICEQMEYLLSGLTTFLTFSYLLSCGSVSLFSFGFY